MTDRNRDPFKLPEINSPPWQTGTRLTIAGLLILLVGVLVYATRGVIAPLVIAFLLAYLLHPLVSRLENWTGMPRTVAVVLVYLLLILLIAGATTGVGLAIAQQVVGIAQDLSALIGQLPTFLRELSESSIQVGPWTVDLAQANLDPLINSLTSSIQPVVSRTGTIVASAVSTTASTVATLVLVLVMGYYLLRDFDHLGGSLLDLVPPEYREDVGRLLDETGRVWGSFLRGQLILGVVMGVGAALVYGAIGMRFALGLGLITGLMEFIPIFGPFIAGGVAVLLAVFQASNFWGLSPLGFVLLVLAIAVLIQQIENTILVPRILGHNLNLHPLIVLVAAISGGLLAGFLGILLAAPSVATMRLWLGYLYRKTVGLDTWPSPVIEASPETPTEGIWTRLRDWLPRFGRARADPVESADSKESHEA